MEFEKIKEIIVRELNLSEDEITLETSLEEDLGADSLDIFQIIMALEEEFDIEFSSEDAEVIKNVKDLVNHIKKSSE